MKNCTVLIVDDNDRNVKICREILEYEGIVVIPAENGEAGLHMASSEKPDVILLDIMMPVMDGFEMLERLKADLDLEDIPVLMLTAKREINDIVKALEMGANDYLRKPFVGEELLARVKTLCRMKKAEDCLRNTISLLKHESVLLSHKAELGLQAGGLAHDINNVLAAAQLVELIPDMLDDPGKLEMIREFVETVRESINLGIEISRGYTNYLSDIGEDAKIQPLAPLFQPLSMYARKYKGQLIQDVPPDIPLVKCKADQIKRVIINLFVNAVQAVEQKKAGDAIIEFKVWHKDNTVFLSAADNGAGIAESVLPNIFKESFTTKENGTGLGLFMVKQIIESHGGSIEVASQLGEGTVFTLSLPAVEKGVS